MPSSGKYVAFDAVVRAELADIKHRRLIIEHPEKDHTTPNENNQPAQNASADAERSDDPTAVQRRIEAELKTARDQNLVGLALSGGGVRSAAVSLGLLQAFYHKRLLNQFDYLSTVSGGGYAGTYLTTMLSKLAKESKLKKEKLKIDWTPDEAGFQHDAPGEKDRRLELALGKGRRQSAELLRLAHGGMYLREFKELINTTLFGVVVNWLMIVASLTAVMTSVAIFYRLMDIPAIDEIPGIERLAAVGEPRVPVQYELSPNGHAFALGDVVEAFGYAGDVPKAFLPSLFIGLVWISVLFVRTLFKSVRWQPRLIRVQSWISLFLIASLLCAVVLIVNTGQVDLAPSVTPSAARVDFRTIQEVQQWAWFVLVSAILISVIPFLRRNDLARSGARSAPALKGWIAKIAVIGMLAGVPLIIFGVIVDENLFGYNESRPDRYEVTRSHVKDWTDFGHRLIQDHGSAKSNHSWRSGPASHLMNARLEGSDATVENQLGEVLKNESIRRQIPRDYWLVERWVRSFFDWANGPFAKVYTARGDSRRQGRRIAGAITARISDPSFYMHFPPPSKWIETALQDTSGEYRRVLAQAAGLQGLPTPSTLTASRQRLTQIQKTNRKLLELWYPESFFPAETVFAHNVWTRDQQHRLEILCWSSCIALILGLVVNVNFTSAHYYYRQRLSEMWMPEFAHGKGMPLTEMANTVLGGPLHLINATVFLNGPKRTPSAEPTEAFLFSQRHCGSQRTDYEESGQYAESAGITVGDAMAISGAAVTPYAVMQNLLLFYALVLINARLGQWVRNPGEDVFPKYPTFLHSIFCYFFATPEKNPHLYVSDGGLHDNTGIESLLRRRCRVIVALDASWDPKGQFLDLLRLFRRMTAFEGIEFTSHDGNDIVDLSDVVADPKTKESPKHFALIRITYPEAQGTKRPSWLIYAKSSLTGDEKPEVLRYREDNEDFPHDPTLDQFYDPRRFECYRELGYHIGDDLCNCLRAEDHSPTKLWLKSFDSFKQHGDPVPTDRSLLKHVLSQVERGGKLSPKMVKLLKEHSDAMSRGGPGNEKEAPSPTEGAGYTHHS